MLPASMDNGCEPCFSEFVYDDDALDRVPEDRRAFLDEHVQRCPECARRLAEARVVAPALQELLPRVQMPPVGQCPTDEWLALYLDATLDEDAQTAVAHHLSTCRPCLKRLVDLYTEVHQSLDSDGDLADILGQHPAAANALPLVRPQEEQSALPLETTAGSAETATTDSPSNDEQQRQFPENQGRLPKQSIGGT